MILLITAAALLLLILMGIPVAFALGMASFIDVGFADGLPLALVPERMVAQIDSFTLLTVPFFVFAGTLMFEGGISRRLVEFAANLVGRFKGGLAMACVVSTMIFAGLSGSSAADASAIGAIVIPALILRGYPPAFVASLQAAAATMGPMFPPSTLAVIYGSIVSVSVVRLFLGGVIPGLLMGLALLIMVRIYAEYFSFPIERPASRSEVWISFKRSLLALLVPVIVLTGMLCGIFTAAEAGAIVALYSLIVAMFVYRELKWSAMPRLLLRSALTSAVVMFVIAAAGPISWILADAAIPTLFHDFVVRTTDSPAIALFLVLGFMLIVGCVLEIVPAGIIMIPVLAPIAVAYRIDPVHFAVLIMMTMAIGAITPSMGITLFITVGLADVKLSQVHRYIWPMIALLTAVLAFCAAVPATITYLPHLFVR